MFAEQLLLVASYLVWSSDIVKKCQIYFLTSQSWAHTVTWFIKKGVDTVSVMQRLGRLYNTTSENNKSNFYVDKLN